MLVFYSNDCGSCQKNQIRIRTGCHAGPTVAHSLVCSICLLHRIHNVSPKKLTKCLTNSPYLRIAFVLIPATTLLNGKASQILADITLAICKPRL